MGNCISNDIREVFLFSAIAFRDQGSTLCLEWAGAGLVRLTRAPASVQRFSAKFSHARKVSVAVIQPFRSISYFKAYYLILGVFSDKKLLLASFEWMPS